MRRGVALLIVGLGLLSVGLMPLNIFAQDGHHQSGVTGEVFIDECVEIFCTGQMGKMDDILGSSNGGI